MAGRAAAGTWTPSIAPTQKAKQPSVNRPKPAARLASFDGSPLSHAAMAGISFIASAGCLRMATQTWRHVR